HRRAPSATRLAETLAHGARRKCGEVPRGKRSAWLDTSLRQRGPEAGVKYDHGPMPSLHELPVVARVVEPTDNLCRRRLVLERLHDDLQLGDRAVVGAIYAEQTAAPHEVVLAVDGAARETAHKPIGDGPDLLGSGARAHIGTPNAR